MAHYTGGCHCGKVAYGVEMELDGVMECNCSICQKRGSLLAFTPAENFTLISGQEDLIDYQFNKQIIHHLFCNTCGILSFAMGVGPDGANMVAVNVRCLDDVDLKSLTLTPYDGRSM